MTTKLYQLELDQTNIDCGMSYVFHMNNGRFFIIDGGYFTLGEDDRLLSFLQLHSTGIPVIAGWFFSHAHQDHVGAFIELMHKNSDKVKIERLIYNFQPFDFSGATGDWRSSDPATFKEFYNTVDKYCSGCELIIPLRGDVIELGEIRIEVLYTNRDLFPLESSFNDNSTVISTEVCGQKIIWLGDIFTEGSRILLERVSDKLKAGIVQISHHGFNGATLALYKAISAEVALWPTPDYGFENNLERDANAWLISAESGVREHIVSGLGTAELTLPYTPGECSREEKRFAFTRSPEQNHIPRFTAE